MDIDNGEQRNTGRMNLTLKLKLRIATIDPDDESIGEEKKKKKSRAKRLTIHDPCRLISFTFTELGSPRGYRSLVPLDIGRIDGLAAV